MSQLKKSQIARAALWSILFLVGGFGLMRLMISMKSKPVQKKRITRVFQVETEIVKRHPVTMYLKGMGTAEALRKIDLIPEVSGRAVYVSKNLKQGGRVRKGSLLVRIDNRSYRTEYYRLKKQLKFLREQASLLEKVLVLEKRSLARSTRLLKRKAINQDNYDKSQIRLLDKQRSLAVLSQNIANTKSLLQNALLNVRKTRLYSPFSGRVVKGSIEKGDFLSQARTLVSLESQEAVEIPVAFSLSALADLRDEKGKEIDIEELPRFFAKFSPVEVRTASSSYQWKGRIVRVGGDLDRSTRTLTLWVRVVLKDRFSRKIRTLLPGTFCQIRIPVKKSGAAVAIPSQAVTKGYVYLAVNNKIERRKVKLGMSQGGRRIVLSGLQSGELLVLNPSEKLNDGMRVQLSHKVN